VVDVDVDEVVAVLVVVLDELEVEDDVLVDDEVVVVVEVVVTVLWLVDVEVDEVVAVVAVVLDEVEDVDAVLVLVVVDDEVLVVVEVVVAVLAVVDVDVDEVVAVLVVVLDELEVEDDVLVDDEVVVVVEVVVTASTCEYTVAASKVNFKSVVFPLIPSTLAARVTNVVSKTVLMFASSTFSVWVAVISTFTCCSVNNGGTVVCPRLRREVPSTQSPVAFWTFIAAIFSRSSTMTFLVWSAMT